MNPTQFADPNTISNPSADQLSNMASMGVSPAKQNTSVTPFNLNTAQSTFPSGSLGGTNTYGDLLNQAGQYRNQLTSLYLNNGDVNSARESLNNLNTQVLGAQNQMNQGIFGLRSNGALTQQQASPFVSQAQLTGSANLANLGVAQSGASNALNVLQQGRADTATGLNYGLSNVQNLLSATKPTAVAAGSTLTDPLTGQPINPSQTGANSYSNMQSIQTYANLQQNYPDAMIPQYNPQLSAQDNLAIAQDAVTKNSAKYQSSISVSPASVSTAAVQLMATTPGLSYSDAYNQAYQQMTNIKRGQNPIAPGQGTDYTQAPVYQNTMAALKAGQPFDQIVTSGGGKGIDQASAQQAYSDFLQQNKGYNPQVADANAKAVTDLVGQKADTQRAITTAESNFPLLLSVVKKAGVNDFNSPLANQLQQAVNNKLIGSGDMASFNALVTSLQTEYSQIISRGGSVTDKTRTEAEQIINGKIGYSALNDLYTTLQKESGNVIKGYDDGIKGLLKQGQGSSSAGGTSGGWPGWNPK